MLNRLKKTLMNCSTTLQLKKKNEFLLNENLELLNTIEQLNSQIAELKTYYLELSTVYNELLSQRNESEFKAEQNTKLLPSEIIETSHELNRPNTFVDRLTGDLLTVNLEELEDKNNVIIRYLRFDNSGTRIPPLGKNNIPWTESLILQGGRYQLFIQLDVTDERTWEIGLVRDGYCIPKGYRLKAVTDKDEDFEGNEVIATGDTHDIYLSLEIAEGEGLKFEIYPEPDDYLESRIFWFY